MGVQMTWQGGVIKLLKRKQPLGLRNLGNTCYLNSVLQCLTFTPPLASFCLRFLHSSNCDSGTGKENKGDCPFCILEKRIGSSLRTDSVHDAPLKLYSCLKIYAKHFRPGRQEDAHEFLRYVIDACHNTCLRLKKLKYGVVNGGSTDVEDASAVKEIFGGALRSQVKCMSCGAESNKDDEIMDFSLDILHTKSLNETLRRFFQPEVLDGSNKYKCDNCKELVAARKQMSILEAPNVLVIQLKRFEGVFGGKIDKLITFDDTLDISNYMCKQSQDPNPKYNLFGTIVHSGFSLDSGHYYAYIKDAFDCWYCCNDSYVSLSTLQDVLSEKVYILFFSRTKQRPRTTRINVSANGSKSHESNGIKKNSVNGSGHIDTPVCMEQPEPLSETNTSPTTNSNNLAEKLVNMKDSNHHSKTSGQNINGLCGRQKKITLNGSTGKPIVNGGIKFSINKKKAREENSCSEPSVMPEKKEDNGLSVFKINGASKELANGVSKESANGVSKESANGVSKESANGVSKELGDGIIEKNGDIEAFSSNSGMKRKRANDNTCILLAEDAISRSEVVAFKERIGKEASAELRSCGWYDEVHSFMHERKKTCHEAGGVNSNALDMKTRLISHAKKSLTSKIPESLRRSLVDRLKAFSQEKPPNGT